MTDKYHENQLINNKFNAIQFDKFMIEKTEKRKMILSVLPSKRRAKKTKRAAK